MIIQPIEKVRECQNFKHIYLRTIIFCLQINRGGRIVNCTNFFFLCYESFFSSLSIVSGIC